MNKHDSDKERRKQRYLERIGTEHPVCITCGGTEWCTFEGHHIAGRLFDKHVEFFCANCHRLLSESQKSHPKVISKAPETVERAGHYCLGLTDILTRAARTADKFGHQLLELGHSDEITSDASRSLTLDVGHFLIALALILENVVRRLEQYGSGLCDEAARVSAGGRGRAV
jgi:hypothetical protein